MRLLFVDDDRINALLFEQLCQQAGGIELRCAESGAEALEVAADWRPQLMVLDLHLPDTDGCSLLPRLRQAAGRPGLPAVLCTAELPADVAGQAQAAGFGACWPKPLLLDEVRDALRRFGASLTREASA